LLNVRYIGLLEEGCKLLPRSCQCLREDRSILIVKTVLAVDLIRRSFKYLVTMKNRLRNRSLIAYYVLGTVG